MRFLLHVRPRGVQLPPEQGLELFKAVKAALEERKRSGEIEVSYSAAGNVAGSWSIVNVQSTEQMQERITTFPGSNINFWDWEVYPVIDTLDFVTRGLQLAEAAAVPPSLGRS